MLFNFLVFVIVVECDSFEGDEGKESFKEIFGIWELLKDEMGVEDWEGWIVDGKWFVYYFFICFF